MGASAEQINAVSDAVAATPWLMRALEAARALGLPNWAVAAGAVRGVVWDQLHGFEQTSVPSDLDLVYFDPTVLDDAQDRALEASLAEVLPGVAWEVVNQAGVHRWYATKFGRQVPPFASLESALAAWPETATAVGVRLEDDGQLSVVAPLGLADLLGLVLRPSAQCRVEDAFETRLIEKRFKQRWPKLRVIAGLG